MSEYIKKKDVVNGLSGWAFSVMPSAMADTLLEAADAIERMPTIDIVRCGECRYGDPEHRGYEESTYCEGVLMCRNAEYGGNTLGVLPDHFCGFGERRTE